MQLGCSPKFRDSLGGGPVRRSEAARARAAALRRAMARACIAPEERPDATAVRSRREDLRQQRRSPGVGSETDCDTGTDGNGGKVNLNRYGRRNQSQGRRRGAAATEGSGEGRQWTVGFVRLSDVLEFVDAQEQVRPDDQQRQGKRRHGTQRAGHAARTAVAGPRRTLPPIGGIGAGAQRSEHGGGFLLASELHRGSYIAGRDPRQWTARIVIRGGEIAGCSLCAVQVRGWRAGTGPSSAPARASV